MTASARRRPRLREREHTTAWGWFCGYCAATPPGSSVLPATRVCPRCGMGLVLEAPKPAIPARGDPFLVVDGELIVRALSAGAERLLRVKEPEVVDEPLDELLPMAVQRGRLRATVEAAAGGDERIRRASVLLGGELGSVRASITCCGPVAGALIVLDAPRQARR